MAKLLIKKLHLGGEEFVTSETIKKYCKPLKLNHKSAIKYLLKEGYLLRIFRGIFYIRTFDEIKLGKSKYSHLELVTKGMELKGVKNWYFGLYTALKLNNLTHEHFAIDYMINDKIFRAKPIEIAGYKFRFLKLKPELFGFGIIKDTLRYSDPEKTILDFIYVWRYNGIPEEKIIMDISDYARGLSKKKMRVYAENYSKAVKEIAEKVK
ncbi:MAG: hypothetical protein L6244_01295 [Candidatus Methanoperedenaceae archaeon]|nr:hypothetical protein [Euryarchaeota archaeon]MCG2727273.1 hypothetical protein [Candidatus Methanoperedenaceae archaeon]